MDFDAYKKVVVHHAGLGLDLSPSVLKGIKEQAEWETLISNHRTAVERWLIQNRQAQIIYAPTTKVWRNWLDPAGPLGSALEMVARDDASRRTNT